jgi:putative chitinase
MAIDRAKFFAGIRNGPFPGSLSQEAVRGITAILDEWERRGLTDLRWLAKMLATVLAECGPKMLPVREIGRGQGKKYGIPVNGHIYYGRGLVQLTWIDNYRKMAAITGLDLVNKPDLALEPAAAAKIMFEGMIQGTFTGKKLADYFNATTTDWKNARRIINGLDRADEIAGYSKQFYADLVAAYRPGVIEIAKKAGRDAGIAGGATGLGKSGEGAAVAPDMPFTEILIAMAVIAALVFAASFAWRWWQARKAAEVPAVDSAVTADEPSEVEAIEAAPANADALAAEIANKARGGVACQVAADEMAKPTKRRKRKAIPVKRAKAKAKKRRAK